jgi:hypothetical protein
VQKAKASPYGQSRLERGSVSPCNGSTRYRSQFPAQSRPLPKKGMQLERVATNSNPLTHTR